MRKPSQYNFSDEFELEHNGVNYYVEVSGVKIKDEYDFNSYYTEVEKVRIVDEENNPITDVNDEYDELIEEIINRDYDAEYEEECMDYVEEDLS